MIFHQEKERCRNDRGYACQNRREAANNSNQNNDDVLKCRAMLEALKKQSALRIRSVEFEAKTWRTKHTEESDRNTQLQYEKK